MIDAPVNEYVRVTTDEGWTVVWEHVGFNMRIALVDFNRSLCRKGMDMSEGKGRRVQGLYHLDDLADRKRAVMCSAWSGGRRVAAAFVISMQGREIMRLLRAGLFEYIPKKERNDG